ncbi:MAG: hypothetical protein FWF22_03940 [Treponema sp.]|nr:hypothetical protein [Treponema sp.]
MFKSESCKIPENVGWIGSPERKTAGLPIETAYFKLLFDVTEVKPFRINISAFSRFCLYVNGAALLDGPCKGDKWRQYCETLDISASLKSGRNVLAVKAAAYPPREAMNSAKNNMGPMSVYSNSAGPLLILWSDETAAVSTGQADWYVANDTAIAWNQCQRAIWMGSMEEVSGEKLPHNWQSALHIEQGFEKAALKLNTAMLYGEMNLPRLYARPVKPLLRINAGSLHQVKGFGNFIFDEKTNMACLPPNGSYKMLLDLGRLTTSFVELPVSGGKGAKISIGYAESFGRQSEDVWIEKGDRADFTGEFLGVFDIYHPGGGKEVYKPFWFRTFRFIMIEVQTGAAVCEISIPLLTETRYPLEDKVQFESKASPWLKDVWEISLRTLQLCIHETYEDCPFYEQLQYAMDTRLEILYTYAISNDTSMAGRTIYDFHSSLLPEGITQSRFPSIFPQVIPLFSLYWVLMLKDYYMETGDLEYIRGFRHTMGGILDWFENRKREHGLVEGLDYWEFVDWSDEWYLNRGIPTAVKKGPSSVNNMVYCYALDEASKLLELMGDYDESARLCGQADRIRRQLDTLCWSNEKQLYRDGPGFEEEYSQHAQIFAVLCGLAKDGQAKALMNRVMTDKSLVRCSFVMSYYLFRALEKAGLYELTDSLWDAWKMLPAMNLTTVPEKPGSTTRSDCHAWGSLLLNELPRKMLGVEPELPGYAAIRIEPKALYIGGIRGKAPTPFGDVEVEWKIDNGRFAIKGYTPVPARLVMPGGQMYRLDKGDFSF